MLMISSGLPTRRPVDHSALTLQEIFQMHNNNGVRVCSYILKDKKAAAIETIRIAVNAPLRKAAGFRIIDDRPHHGRSDSANVVGLRRRIDFAKGGWMLADFLKPFFADGNTLRKWSVIVLGANSRPRLDPVMHAWRERIARAFLAVRVRTMAYWQGGIYRLAAAIDPEVRDEVIAEAVALFKRILKMEEPLAVTQSCVCVLVNLSIGWLAGCLGGLVGVFG